MVILKHILKALKCSLNGFVLTFRSEFSFKLDLLLFLMGIMICFLLPLTGFERALMIFSLFLILLMELINTAIETIVNRISTDYHQLSGKAKDIGSSLVFFAILNAVIVWGLILFG